MCLIVIQPRRSVAAATNSDTAKVVKDVLFPKLLQETVLSFCEAPDQGPFNHFVE